MVLLDDYQSTGTTPIDVKDLGIDFLVTGMVKYMIGPPGLSFIYVREGLIQDLRPSVTGWFGRTDPFALDVEQLDYAPTANRFETGTFPVGAIYASIAALNVIKAVGLATIADHIATLARRAIPSLYQLGFNVTTPADSTGPLLVIETDQVHKIVEQLAKENILFAGRNNLFRISFHGYNTPDEVEALLGVLRRLKN
jgi:selenocysteine lyase/cysteine desulfurase